MLNLIANFGPIEHFGHAIIQLIKLIMSKNLFHFNGVCRIVEVSRLVVNTVGLSASVQPILLLASEYLVFNSFYFSSGHFLFFLKIFSSQRNN